jgi:F-type H+-transporting ATPase subunit delta|tara:strand:- start:230 stop:778 length:549 start_codon:yes stop_codon:yes gene_type:complete
VSGKTGLTGRYATAIFQLANADNQLDKVAKDFLRLDGMIRSSKDLERLIHSPIMSRKDQGRALTEILNKAGMCELTQSFVGTIAENRRLYLISEMITSYNTLLADHLGEATAEIVTAMTLTDKQIKQISISLKKAIGSNVAIKAKVDESVLGGLIIKIGSKMVDGSLRTKLQQLRFSMKGIG